MPSTVPPCWPNKNSSFFLMQYRSIYEWSQTFEPIKLFHESIHHIFKGNLKLNEKAMYSEYLLTTIFFKLSTEMSSLIATVRGLNETNHHYFSKCL